MMAYVFLLFFHSFSAKNNTKYLTLAICCPTIISIALALCFLPIGLLRSLLMVIFPFIVSMCFDLKLKNRILLSLLAFGLGTISELLIMTSLSVIFSIDTNTATTGTYQVIGIVLSKIIMLFFVAFFRFRKYYINYQLSAKRLIALLAIPSATLVISMVHVSWLTQVSDISPALASTNIISYIILLASNVIVFHLIDFTYQSTLKDQQLAAITELIHSQTKQYEQIQQQNHEVLRLKHNFKHYLIGLITMLENGDTNSCLISLKEKYTRITSHGEFVCMSSIILTTIKIKSEQAAIVGVTLDTNYKNIDATEIPPVDVAIILGNALDNAIEATQELPSDKRQIDVFVNIVNDLIVLIIKNPVKADVNTDNLVSSKRKDGSFGYGIASMKSIAAKYGGEVLISCKNQNFCVKIVLRNKTNKQI